MTPQEKAEELVNKYKPFVYCFIGSSMLTNTEDESVIITNSKQCALIAVNEIIESRKADPDFDDTKLGIVTHYIAPHPLRLSYWVKVKEEIEKL